MSVIKLSETGMAGTMESSDIHIVIEPKTSEGVEILLESIVIEQFGDQILSVIKDSLSELGVDGVKVTAIDRGALDCTIKARVKAAALRGIAEKQSVNWGELL